MARADAPENSPWFVAWQNGVPEWRAAEAGKRDRARDKHLCWVENK